METRLVQITPKSPPKPGPARRPLLAKAGAFRFASRLERDIVRKVGEAVGHFDLISE